MGPVPSLEALYDEAAVVISPLSVGSGLKIKLVEALGHGKAIVATSATVSGFEVLTRDAVAVADDPAAFAAGVTALLKDPALRSGSRGQPRSRSRASGSRPRPVMRTLWPMSGAARCRSYNGRLSVIDINATPLKKSVNRAPGGSRMDHTDTKMWTPCSVYVQKDNFSKLELTQCPAPSHQRPSLLQSQHVPSFAARGLRSGRFPARKWGDP